MLTREQGAVVEALATVHGAAKVLPLPVDRGAVLACGWDDVVGDGGTRVSDWLYVREDGASSRAHQAEIASALEYADRVAADWAEHPVRPAA